MYVSLPEMSWNSSPNSDFSWGVVKTQMFQRGSLIMFTLSGHMRRVQNSTFCITYYNFNRAFTIYASNTY